MKSWPIAWGKLLAIAPAAALAFLSSACFTIVAHDRPPAFPGAGTGSPSQSDAALASSHPPSAAFTLTIQDAGVWSESFAAANGRVKVSPAPDVAGDRYSEGIVVTLTAAPDSGYTLLAWGGDCSSAAGDWCTLDMSTDKRVSVAFQPQPGGTEHKAGAAAAGSP